MLPLWCYCAPLPQVATKVSLATPADMPTISTTAAESNALLQRDMLRITRAVCPSMLSQVAERMVNSCNRGAIDLVDSGQFKAAWRVLTLAAESCCLCDRAPELRSMTYSNMACMLFKQAKYDKALAYAQKAHTVANMTENSRAIGSALLNVASCTAMLGEWGAAAHLCTKAIYKLRVVEGCEGACVLAMHNMGACEIQQLKVGEKFDPGVPVEILREASILAEQALPEGHQWRAAVDQANQVAISLNLSVSLGHSQQPLKRTKIPRGSFGLSAHRSLSTSACKAARRKQPRRLKTAPRERNVVAAALPTVADQIEHSAAKSKERARWLSSSMPTSLRIPTENPSPLHSLASSRRTGGMPMTSLQQLDGGLQALVQQRSSLIRSNSASQLSPKQWS